jgi:hypothetical protein
MSIRNCVICFFVGLAVIAASCSDDDGTTPSGEPHRIEVEVTYPAGSVTTGYRPSVAVYRAEDYDDFSARPAAMPVAALVGEEGANSVSGYIMDLAQSEPHLFEPGDYSVVAGVAEATGMPSHVEGTVWLPVSVTIEGQDAFVSLDADADWSQ